MNPNWAEENLLTIRTLMENTAIYRRALAPIMVMAGIVASVAGLAGWYFRIWNPRPFVVYWCIVSLIVIVGALLIARRQAIKDKEPFWSPPTRKVAKALMPSLIVGLVVTAVCWRVDIYAHRALVSLWSMLYGCSLHAAGFFAPRTLRNLGWLFILAGAMFEITLLSSNAPSVLNNLSPHLAMAGIFGALHLGYGLVLYLTGKRSNAS